MMLNIAAWSENYYAVSDRYMTLNITAWNSGNYYAAAENRYI